MKESEQMSVPSAQKKSKIASTRAEMGYEKNFFKYDFKWN